MAVKSIIDIEVSDGAFQAFQANFKRYQDALAKQPAAWDDVKKSIDGSAKSFQALVTASIARQAHARTIAAAETEATRQLDHQSRTWRDMARSTKDVAGNIINATRSLLRWGALTSIFSGLLGAGGLFGIERLAQSAGGQRRSSLGLGITPGQQRSFGLNYGRIVDTDSVLSATNAALTDPRQRGNLYNAGLTESDIRGRDAAQVSVELINSLKKLADATRPEMLGGVFAARNLGATGISLEDLQRIRNTPASELAGYRRNFGRNTASLDLTSGQQRAWQDFKVQLDRAGGQIETTFITGLTPLMGPLTKLSGAFSDLVRSAFLSPTTKRWIDDIASGLETFAKFVGTQEFKSDVETFVADVGKLTKAIGGAVHWLFSDKPRGDLREGAGPPLTEPTQAEADAGARRWWEWLKRHAPTSIGEGEPLVSPMGYRGAPAFGAARVWQTSNQGGGFGSSPQPGANDNSGNAKLVHDYFRARGWSEVATAGLMANIKAESDFDPSRVNRVGGDAGLMQWRGSRARQFESMTGHRVQDGTLLEQLNFANWELTQGPEREHGNYLRTIRDYGRAGDYVARAIERPDPNRIDAIAAQRAGLAARYGQQFGGPVVIRIENNTGGNAVVTAAQLAS